MSLRLDTRVKHHSTVVGIDVGGTGKTLIPSLRPSLYRGERGRWDADLVITRTARRGTYEHRFNVGYVDATGSCRRVHGGAIVPGPYAYAYGLASVLSAEPSTSTGAEARRNVLLGVEHHVEPGDLLQLGCELFAVRYDRTEWIDLDHVGSVL